MRLVLLFVLALVLSLAASAETNSFATSEPLTNAKAIRLQTGGGFVYYPGEGSARLQSGELGYQAGFSAAVEVAPSFYVGIDTAFMRFSFDPYRGNGALRQRAVARGDERTTTATGFQLLTTSYYVFEVSQSVRTYVGFSIGPNIYTVSHTLTSPTRGVGNRSAQQTRALFQLLGRLGVDIDLSPTVALNLEPKAGVLDTYFIFAPQASLAIGL